MDIDITEIEARIRSQFEFGNNVLFWEDEPAEYRDAIASLDIEGCLVIDATRRELASKREVLRGSRPQNVVVYRAGIAPHPGRRLPVRH